MDCIVIDDELAARAVVTKLCSDNGFNVLREFPNAIEAIKYLNEGPELDVIFLDLQMPDFSGVDFLKTVKDLPLIVLTTSNREFALESYEYPTVVDYLLKPISQERFRRMVDKVSVALKHHTDPGGPTLGSVVGGELYINIDRRLVKVKLDDILFVEAKGDYIEVRTQSKTHRVHSTMKKIREKLPETLFLQIHRSYIINFTKIIDIEDNSVLIEKNVIPISRSGRPELMRRLNLL